MSRQMSCLSRNKLQTSTTLQAWCCNMHELLPRIVGQLSLTSPISHNEGIWSFLLLSTKKIHGFQKTNDIITYMCVCSAQGQHMGAQSEVWFDVYHGLLTNWVFIQFLCLKPGLWIQVAVWPHFSKLSILPWKSFVLFLVARIVHSTVCIMISYTYEGGYCCQRQILSFTHACPLHLVSMWDSLIVFCFQAACTFSANKKHMHAPAITEQTRRQAAGPKICA